MFSFFCFSCFFIHFFSYLKQLLKLTPKTHPDYEKLTETLEKVNEIARFVNNYKDEDKKLREILDQIEGCPIVCFFFNFL